MVCGVVPFKVRKNKTLLLRIQRMARQRNQQSSPVKARTKHGSYTVFKSLSYRIGFCSK